MSIFRFGMALALGLATATMAADRVGPVSQYGQLQAGKNAAGQGRIYGSCNDYNTSGHEVQVKGMSLYWSLLNGQNGGNYTDKYYTETAINAMVSNMKAEVIRFAMGTADDDWGNKGYAGDPGKQKQLLKTVVEAAIKNDVYVIIDWHSHTAHTETDKAKEFFKYAAQTYGVYDNVIFEIYNEPAKTCHTATKSPDDACDDSNDFTSWATIKEYAEQVIPVIREYSDNLIVVGTKVWSADLTDASKSPLSNYDNIAYTFHYYGSTHTEDNQGVNAANAIKKGLSVFVTEWGVCEASGNGNIDAEANAGWQNWMNTYQLSSANWSASEVKENCAAFTGTKPEGVENPETLMSGTYYTTSGSMVKGYLSGNPTSYQKCTSGYSAPTSPEPPSAPQVAADGSDIIDDLEDGDNKAYTPGFWFAYNDNGSNGSSFFTNEQTTDKDGKTSYNVVLPNGNNSSYAAGLTGITLDKGTNENDPYVVLALTIDSTKGYDLSSCTTIQYDYKGAEHLFKVVMNDDLEGEITQYNQHNTGVNASTTWQTITISWDDLYQVLGWGNTVDLDKTNIGRFVWDVRDDAQNYLYVDNVRCLGSKFREMSSSSAEPPPASSSSKVVEPQEVSSSSKAIDPPPASSSSNAIDPPASSSSKAIDPPASSSSKAIDPPASSSSKQTTAIVAQKTAPRYSISRSSDFLQISSVNGNTFKVEMFDAMGNAITATGFTHSASIPLNALRKGTYVVRIFGEGATQVTTVNIK